MQDDAALHHHAAPAEVDATPYSGGTRGRTRAETLESLTPKKFQPLVQEVNLILQTIVAVGLRRTPKCDFELQQRFLCFSIEIYEEIRNITP
jgi:hypothetical protein